MGFLGNTHFLTKNTRQNVAEAEEQFTRVQLTCPAFRLCGNC